MALGAGVHHSVELLCRGVLSRMWDVSSRAWDVSCVLSRVWDVRSRVWDVPSRMSSEESSSLLLLNTMARASFHVGRAAAEFLQISCLSFAWVACAVLAVLLLHIKNFLASAAVPWFIM